MNIPDEVISDEALAEEFDLTPVFLEDKIDGSDVAAVPWVEVARARRQAKEGRAEGSANVFLTAEDARRATAELRALLMEKVKG